MKDKTQITVLWILIITSVMLWITLYRGNIVRDAYIGKPEQQVITFQNDKKTLLIEKTDNTKGLWFLDKDGVLTHVTMEGEIYKLQKQQSQPATITPIKEKKDDTGNIGSTNPQ